MGEDLGELLAGCAGQWIVARVIMSHDEGAGILGESLLKDFLRIDCCLTN